MCLPPTHPPLLYIIRIKSLFLSLVLTPVQMCSRNYNKSNWLHCWPNYRTEKCLTESGERCWLPPCPVSWLFITRVYENLGLLEPWEETDTLLVGPWHDGHISYARNTHQNTHFDAWLICEDGMFISLAWCSATHEMLIDNSEKSQNHSWGRAMHNTWILVSGRRWRIGWKI